MKKYWLGMCLGALSWQATADFTIENVGFSTPEAMEYSAVNDRYLVANINGSPFGKDNNGFISMVSPEGKLEALKWIEGGKNGVELSAPKGMVATDDRLYVADIDHLRVFSLPDGKPLKSIHVPGAGFLNGVSIAKQGGVWVTDSGVKEGFKPNGKDAIYHISEAGTITTLTKGEDLGRPNGILQRGDELMMVTIFSGEVHHFDLNGKLLRTQKQPFNRIDGLVEDTHGNVIFSSWKDQSASQWQEGKPLKQLFSGMKSPADLGVDTKRNRLLIPSFLGNKIWVKDLSDS